MQRMGTVYDELGKEHVLNGDTLLLLADDLPAFSVAAIAAIVRANLQGALVASMKAPSPASPSPEGRSGGAEPSVREYGVHRDGYRVAVMDRSEVEEHVARFAASGVKAMYRDVGPWLPVEPAVRADNEGKDKTE